MEQRSLGIWKKKLRLEMPAITLKIDPWMHINLAQWNIYVATNNDQTTSQADTQSFGLWYTGLTLDE